MLASNAGPVVEQYLVADEVDSYLAALPGFDLEVVRTGRGFGPNISRAAVSPDVVLVSSLTGFPLIGKTAVADDRLVVGLLTSAPPGSSWYERDLTQGMMLVWGPGSEHAGVDLAGLGYVLVTASMDHVTQIADQCELDVRLPQSGEIQVLPPDGERSGLRRALESVRDPRQAPVREHDPQDLVHALASMLSSDVHRHAVDRAPKISSRAVVATCVDYLVATGRSPAIPELCSVAGVSERKLRQAFVDTFGMPPKQYLMHRALGEARSQLLRTDQALSVTDIAFDAGFSSPGRFASRYREVFGELPSTTLRRHKARRTAMSARAESV